MTHIVDTSEDNSFDRIFSFLNKVDKDFIPPLSSRVALDAYALKLSTYGTNIFISADCEDLGHAAFYANDEKNGLSFLSSICVVKEYRGFGFAERLLEQVKEIATKRGMKQLSLEVNSKNHAAIAFYIKYGFLRSDAHASDSLLMIMQL